MARCKFCGKEVSEANGVLGHTTWDSCSKCGAEGCHGCIKNGRCPAHPRPERPAGARKVSTSSGDVR